MTPRKTALVRIASLALLLAALGCANRPVVIAKVADLQARGDELIGRRVRIAAQVEYVAGERRDRFLLKDPAQPSDQGVLVRCTTEDFARVKAELDKADADGIAIVGRVYRTEPPESKLQLEFVEIAGGSLRWTILAAIAATALAIAVVVVLLLRRPRQAVEDLAYVREGEETIRRYAQLSILEGGRPVRVWFLGYDRNLTEPRITEIDVVLGSEGLLLGRENPVLGLGSMTFSRRIARLRFDPERREFVVDNLHARKPLLVSDGDGTAPTARVAPGASAIARSGALIHVDEFVQVKLVRRERDDAGPAA
jgi:hypothetical protein